MLTFFNVFSGSSFLSSNSLCLTKAVTKISQLAWHAKHALFLLKLLRILRSKCQKLKQIVHVLPELGQILQLFAALCWQPVPCAAMEALRLLFSSGIFLTSFTSTPGCFISHVIIKVCNKLLTLLQTFRRAREGVLLCSQFWLQFGNRRKLRKIKKIVSHTYAVWHVFKREQVSEMFWLPSQKCIAQGG